MILYHFATSPFSRRVRLALAHKNLAVELRDPRVTPEHMPTLFSLNPMHTAPVLVDGERVLTDSMAILHYLDRKLPTPPLWPAGLVGADAIAVAALADGAVDLLADLGTRYHAVSDHPNFPKVRGELLGRAQRALDALAARVSQLAPGQPVVGDAWSAADIVLYTTVAWLEGLPARAATAPIPKQIVELGWTLPEALRTWAEPLRARPDVAALG